MKPIEEIKEGDLILAFDEQTGEQAFKPVVQLFRNSTNQWYHITANGEEIICTAEHPFYVLGFGFVPAKNLLITDKLLSSNKEVVEIDSISIETLSTPETTYNFEVADYHTYYVSECGVLVHNRCKLGRRMERSGSHGKPNEDAHHVFPHEFKDEFLNDFGLDVDLSENGKWMELHKHRALAKEYNLSWRTYLDSGKVTKANIREIGTKPMQDIYGEVWH